MPVLEKHHLLAFHLLKNWSSLALLCEFSSEIGDALLVSGPIFSRYHSCTHRLWQLVASDSCNLLLKTLINCCNKSLVFPGLLPLCWFMAAPRAAHLLFLSLQFLHRSIAPCIRPSKVDHQVPPLYFLQVPQNFHNMAICTYVQKVKDTFGFDFFLILIATYKPSLSIVLYAVWWWTPIYFKLASILESIIPL